MFAAIPYALLSLMIVALRATRPRVVPTITAVPYALYFATLAVLHGGHHLAWLAVPLDALGTAGIMWLATMRARARDDEIDRRGEISDLTRAATVAIDRAVAGDWQEHARAAGWKPPA